MKKIEQTIDSIEVAEMVGKEHKNVLADVRRYIKQFNELNIQPVDFFQESTYVDSKGETRPCYRITKKGCEFIAHKLTGVKGTAFTARYINRFHEMEEMLGEQPLKKKTKQQPQKLWYIRKFRGKDIVLFRDFETLTGINLSGNYTAFKRVNGLEPVKHWNGYGWKCDNEEFKKQYGFDYGDDSCMCYLTMSGFRRALRIMEEETESNQRAVAVRLLENVSADIDYPYVKNKVKELPENTSIQISIKINGNEIDIC